MVDRPAVTLGLAAATISLAGPASAREKAANSVVTFSSPVPATGCAVKSFTHDSVTGVGDTGLSSVSADWSMRAYRITITARDARSGATVGTATALELAHRPTGA
jgi:hypothetical protein